eukprot:5143667-Amphidinium_carterae.2
MQRMCQSHSMCLIQRIYQTTQHQTHWMSFNHKLKQLNISQLNQSLFNHLQNHEHYNVKGWRKLLKATSSQDASFKRTTNTSDIKVKL